MKLPSDMFFKPLQSLYSRMDKEWDRVAQKYDFQCSGCSDNCCTSLFYHHTFIEKDWLLKGFQTLAPPDRETAIQRAALYCRKTFKSGQPIESQKLMCPLNVQGRCILYAYRPMICRFHGLPHKITRPDGVVVNGNGCAAGNFNQPPPHTLDRTPFYRKMARIEVDYRSRFKRTGKIKLTIAEILISGQDCA